METKRAGDLIIPIDEYPHLYDNDTLRDAIVALEKVQLEVRGKKSLPRMLLVFDRVDVLVGTVRRRDILQGLEPDFLTIQPLRKRKELFDIKIDPNLSELSYDRLIESAIRNAGKKVYEIMQPVRVWIDYDDHIMKAVYEMVSNNISLLPVVKGKKVAGVLRSVDLFDEIARLVLGENYRDA